MDPSDPAGTMDGMSLLQRHPGLRWVAPLTAIAVLAGGVAWQNRATAAPGLEPRSAEQLLTDLASAKPYQALMSYMNDLMDQANAILDKQDGNHANAG